MVAPLAGSESSAWRQRSHAQAQAGRWHEALDSIRRALSVTPDDVDCMLLYGQCLVAHGRRGEARDVAHRISVSSSDRADREDALGTLFTYCEEPLRALPHYQRAVELAPQHGGYRYNLATVQRMLGDLAGAEKNLDQVIAANPNDVQAHYTRADLRTQTTDANHIDAMIGLAGRTFRQARDEIMLCFALAKELEDVARFDESFSYLKRGCDLQRKSMVYDVNDDVATLRRIAQVHDGAAGDGHVGEGAHDPIFVMGLPRSGTTLVQQILGSHSLVQAAGELQVFPAATMAAVHARAGRTVTKLEFVEQAWQLGGAALGQSYLRAAHQHRDGKPRFVDKQPLNYLYAGLIARALPGARLIALARDPMDACYAMFKTLFTNAYPFSYDLRELGLYYAAWHHLLCHWRGVLGSRLLIVQYEDLIEHQEAVTRRIVAHCCLPWDDACLAFEQRSGAVTTASAVQVRRGLYASSVGKWRQVARHLDPLAEELERSEPPHGWSFCGNFA